MSIGKSRVAFTAMALLSIAAQVPAHTDLLQSTPADKSKVAAVEKIELKFLDEVQLTALTLQQGEGQARQVTPLPETWGTEFTIPAKATAAGDYVVSWSAKTDDGHVASGKFRFTLAPAAHTHQH